MGGDGTVLVVVEALDGSQGLKAAEGVADELARDFLAMGPKKIRIV